MGRLVFRRTVQGCCISQQRSVKGQEAKHTLGREISLSRGRFQCQSSYDRASDVVNLLNLTIPFTVAPSKEFFRQCQQMTAILILGIYVLNLGYGFEGSFSRVGDFTFVSQTLRGPDAETTGATNRFHGSWLEGIPVPLPRNFVLGIDVQKKDLETPGKPSYLRGEFREGGWWYYYLYALLVKMPIGTMLLAVLAVLLSVNTSTHNRSSNLSWLVLLVPPVFVFTLVSSQTGLNHHSRYVLPVLPFAFIAISQLAEITWKSQPVAFLVIATSLLASVSSSLWIYPHSLSYFNEFAGGPANGPVHLINSNVDWGQDALFLKKWLDDHPDARPLYLAYWGHFDPKYAKVEYELPNMDDPKPGWYAISVNFLQGLPWHAPDGHGGRTNLKMQTFRRFQRIPPFDKAGNSIYLYRLPIPVPGDEPASTPVEATRSPTQPAIGQISITTRLGSTVVTSPRIASAVVGNVRNTPEPLAAS